MGIGVVPGHVNGLDWMPDQKLLKELGNLFASFSFTNNYHRFPGMIIDRPDAEPFVGLSRRWNHYLLTNGTPHGFQGGLPTHIKLISVVKDCIGF